LLHLCNSADEKGRADLEPLGEFPHVVQRQGTVALEDHRRRRFGHSQERAKLPDLHPVLRDELAQDLERLELRLADGNVRQWIVAGIGGEPDVRQRPKEFSERGPISKSELLRRLDQVLAEAHEALGKASAQDLLRPRCIQGFNVTGLEAIFDSVPHFKGHTQEIIHMTRRMPGNAYKFAWVPSTPQEAAAQ
jgi:Protein of unknown function (DUF1572)